MHKKEGLIQHGFSVEEAESFAEFAHEMEIVHRLNKVYVKLRSLARRRKAGWNRMS